MTTKQTAFLKAMLEESTIKKAAEKAGISRDTAYKYLKNENFQAELNKRRSECVTDTVRFLQSKLSLCSETLVSIVENPETGAQIKINAINAIFANCKALLETTEIAMMGMNHPDKTFTLYQAHLDEYKKDAVLELLKAKLFIDDETKEQIEQIEEEQRIKNNDVKQGKDCGWYHGYL